MKGMAIGTGLIGYAIICDASVWCVFGGAFLIWLGLMIAVARNA